MLAERCDRPPAINELIVRRWHQGQRRRHDQSASTGGKTRTNRSLLSPDPRSSMRTSCRRLAGSDWTVAGHGMGGERNDRCLSRPHVGSEHPRGLPSVEHRQAHVHQDQIEIAVLRSSTPCRPSTATTTS